MGHRAPYGSLCHHGSVFYTRDLFLLFNAQGSLPEINNTKVFVSTVYPGNTAEDIERIVTDPLEEALKGVPNMVEIRSTSSEDFSVIEVEFDENITIDDAKQKTKDLVDGVTAGPDWPVFNNAKVEPNVFELDFSELQPILNISLIGDYPIEQLKVYAERLENRIEQLAQIKEVNIRGIQTFEVEVAVDIYKMTAAKVSFNDILGAISEKILPSLVETSLWEDNVEIFA